MIFNPAMLGSLSNSELAVEAQRTEILDRNTVAEIVKRFVAAVDNGTIDSYYDEDTRIVRKNFDEDENDDLRSAIREAISVLESV
jgi:ABC-type nitrate/sulfonate/bicarbonate transport system substrate-binding protein